MLISIIVISVLIGFVVGAGVIGMTAQRMGRERSQPVWRQEIAANYVESHLAYEAAAQLQPHDLRDLLRHHINQLQYQPQGSQAQGGQAQDGEPQSGQAQGGQAQSGEAQGGQAQDDEASVQDNPLTEPATEPVTLTTHEDAIASLYAQVRSAGLEVTKPVVKEVVDVHLEYLRSIGALVQSTQELLA